MKLVYTAPLLVDAAHVRNVLEAAGIACAVQNEFSGSAAGKLPFVECWPEVWVLDDHDEERARVLIAHSRQPGAESGTWRCSGCGERVEGVFGQCWKCGALRADE